MKFKIEGNEDEIVGLGRRLFRTPVALPPPPDGIYPPGIDSLGSPAEFPEWPPNPDYAHHAPVRPSPYPAVPPRHGFRSRPVAGDGPTGYGPAALTLADAEQLFGGLRESIDALTRRIAECEDELGIPLPDGDEGREPEPQQGLAQAPSYPDEVKGAAEEPEPVGELPPEIQSARRLRALQSVAGDGDLSRADEIQALGDVGAEGEALLKALREAKALLGPGAIAVQPSPGTFAVQDAAMDARVVGMGPSWDAALAAAARQVEANAQVIAPPIPPDEDLPYETACAYAKQFIHPQAVITYSPADSTRNRVCVSLPVGTPGRKMVLEGSFLEALAKYAGKSVEVVRSEAMNLAPDAPSA